MDVDNPVDFGSDGVNLNFDAGNDFLFDDGILAAGISSVAGSARKRKVGAIPVSCHCYTIHHFNDSNTLLAIQ